ncbi:MAG: hypothetical protein ACI9G1_003604 [Pirellulaceae bacterium]|jgi:hypothetical protein
MAGDLCVGAAGAGAAIGAAAAGAASEIANDGYGKGTTEGIDIKINSMDIKISGDYDEPQERFEFPPEVTTPRFERIEVEYQSFDSQGHPIRPKVPANNSTNNNSNNNVDRYFREQMKESIRQATGTGGENPVEAISEGFIQEPFVYIKE